jgi:hypothetical protein
MREQAGLNKDDLVEFAITRKVVVGRSQFPSASGEYTPAQRRAIDARVAKSGQDIKRGEVYGPFETHKEFLAALHRAAAKPDRKSTKRPAK